MKRGVVTVERHDLRNHRRKGAKLSHLELVVHQFYDRLRHRILANSSGKCRSLPDSNVAKAS